MKKEYGRSMQDIREVLRREPRHFGALSGLGMILNDIGDESTKLVELTNHAVDKLLTLRDRELVELPQNVSVRAQAGKRRAQLM